MSTPFRTLLLSCCIVAVSFPSGSVRAQEGFVDALPAPVSERTSEPRGVEPEGEPVPQADPSELDEDAARRAGDPPIGMPDFYVVEQDQVLDVDAAEGVMRNDREPEGESFFVRSFFPPANGTLSLVTTGAFTYEPDLGFTGVDSFRYTLSDGDVTSDLVTVRFDVQESFARAPIAVADHFSVAAGETLVVEAPGLLANDYDLDGDAVTAQSFFQPPNGDLSLNVAGAIQYVPDAGFTGTETFTYSISDGSLNSEAAGDVSIVVYDGNRAPVSAQDAYYTPADTPLSIDAPGLLVNDVDPDGDTVIAQSFFPPENGDVSLVVNGSFTYTPDPGFVGIDTFVYTSSDREASSTSTTVTLFVGTFGDIATGVLTPPTPGGFALEAPTPNPFNPSTELRFRLDDAGPAQLSIYDLRGRLVRELVAETRAAGTYTATWDGTDASGRSVASGAYVAELRSGSKRAVQKLQLVK
jgi:hypothetical protein